MRRNLTAQAEALARRPRGDAASVCWTSNQVKTGLPYRAVFTARDTAELADTLRTAAADEHTLARVTDRALRPPALAFLYPGQGCQEPGMTAALYRESVLYRRHLDDADDALRPHTGDSVRDLILADDPAIHHARWAQPALFAVAHALTKTLAELGVVPDAVLGHGTGELAAAVAAGMLTLPDAARLVAAHATAAHDLPDGGMLSVRATPQETAGILAAHPGLFLAAVDGPHDTVLSGTADVLRQAAADLAAHGLNTRRLPVPHAAQGSADTALAARIAALASPVTATPARIALASARHGRMLRDEIPDTAYWADLAVQPVRFADALSALMTEAAPTCLVELGPAAHLLSLARQGDLPTGIRLLHPAPGRAATFTDLAETVGGLYLSGVEPCWDALYEPAHRRTERLAPYVFSGAHRFGQTAAAPPAAQPAAPDTTPRQESTGGSRPPHPGGPDTPADRPDPALSAVIEAVVEVGAYAREQVNAEARLYEDLGFDSVMIMQLKNRIEQQLPQGADITVPQLLPALKSVGALAAFVRELTSTGGTV
ncbi:acyltransferase domain-containing protein [Streptomyces kaempferi]